jgi:hypothetical protein
LIYLGFIYNQDYEYIYKNLKDLFYTTVILWIFFNYFIFFKF